MGVSVTAADGVIDGETRIHFVQKGTRVLGRYHGGSICRGYLMGSLRGDALTFRYVQREATGEIHTGRSFCDVTRTPGGRLRVIEHFQWRSRKGHGTNVFDEIPRGIS